MQNTSRSIRRVMITVGTLVAMTSVASAQGLSDHVGFDVHTLHRTELPGRANADRIQESGVGWARIEFTWHRIQPCPPGYRESVVATQSCELGNTATGDGYAWLESGTEEMVVALEERGVHIFATLAYTPRWARASTACHAAAQDHVDGSACPPDMARWEAFVRAAAARYAGRVTFFGIWNEPNTPESFSGTAAEYDQLLVAGCRGIRTGNASAKCVGPSGDGSNDPGALDWLRARLDAARAAGFPVDVIDVHNYSPASTFLSQIQGVISALRNGGHDEPVWVTETSFALGDAQPGTRYEQLERDVVQKVRYLQNDNILGLDKVFFYEVEQAAGSDFGFTSGSTARRRPAFNALRGLMHAVYGDCPAGQCTGTDGVCCSGSCVYRPDTSNDEYACNAPAPGQARSYNCDLAAYRANAGSAEGIVDYTYCLIHDRAPDSGKSGWVTAVANGWYARSDLPWGFYQSSEFQNRYSVTSLSNSDWVTLMYQVLLRREPDQAGHDYWVQRLDGGESREVIFRYYFTAWSAEFQQLHPYYSQ